MPEQTTDKRYRLALEDNIRLRQELDTLRADKFAARGRDMALRSMVLLTPADAMLRVGGYRSRSAFVKMARRTGLRRIKLNSRVIRYELSDFEAWLRRRAA